MKKPRTDPSPYPTAKCSDTGDLAMHVTGRRFPTDSVSGGSNVLNYIQKFQEGYQNTENTKIFTKHQHTKTACLTSHTATRSKDAVNTHFPDASWHISDLLAITPHVSANSYLRYALTMMFEFLSAQCRMPCTEKS